MPRPVGVVVYSRPRFQSELINGRNFRTHPVQGGTLVLEHRNLFFEYEYEKSVLQPIANADVS